MKHKMELKKAHELLTVYVFNFFFKWKVKIKCVVALVVKALVIDFQIPNAFKNV